MFDIFVLFFQCSQCFATIAELRPHVCPNSSRQQISEKTVNSFNNLINSSKIPIGPNLNFKPQANNTTNNFFQQNLSPQTQLNLQNINNAQNMSSENNGIGLQKITQSITQQSNKFQKGNLPNQNLNNFINANFNLNGNNDQNQQINSLTNCQLPAALLSLNVPTSISSLFANSYQK